MAYAACSLCQNLCDSRSMSVCSGCRGYVCSACQSKAEPGKCKLCAGDDERD